MVRVSGACVAVPATRRSAFERLAKTPFSLDVGVADYFQLSDLILAGGLQHVTRSSTLHRIVQEPTKNTETRDRTVVKKNTHTHQHLICAYMLPAGAADIDVVTQ